MSYRIYEPEPMAPALRRVMKDWYDGRCSMFFKVSIGESESKRVRPTVKKHFVLIGLEAGNALAEMTDQTAADYPDDVIALQDLAQWANRQKLLIGARESLEAAVKAAVMAGMASEAIVSYVQCAVTAHSLPTD